jgi:hypothetical protein
MMILELSDEVEKYYRGGLCVNLQKNQVLKYPALSDFIAPKTVVKGGL